jgi:hypothetical protein
MTVRLPDEAVEKLNAMPALSRSAFMRRAIERALADEVGPVKRIDVGFASVAGAAVKPMNPIPDRGKAEIALLLEALKVRPMTAREAADELGLPVMKVTAMEKALSQAGMIEYQAPGVMRAKPGL